MPRVLKDPNSPDSDAGAVIAGNTVRIHGNQDNFLLADDKGVTINGPMSFPSGSGQMRFGALWTMNSEIALSLPSTMATPTPVMQISPPVGQIANLIKDVAVMTALIAAFVAL